MGHKGWVKVKCIICGKRMDLTNDEVYVCPKCRELYHAYFCYADAKVLHYKCPFCNGNITLL